MGSFPGAIFLSVLCVVFDVGSVQSQPTTCTSKYANAGGATHTMCLTDDPNAKEVTLTQEVKDAIVKRHNEIRAGVSPAATNMQKMIWDDRLARVAAKWAMQCHLGHDKNRGEPELPGNVGQNVAWNQGSFAVAVNAWYSEVKDWTHGVWSSGTGHYIQQIFHSASRVGCGQAQCSNGPFYVCNYFRGTLSNQGPYEIGKSCEKCPDNCDATGKLCDCGGRVCGNGGTLDLNSCSCVCPPLWTGDDCTTMNCPKRDFKQWCSYPSFDAAKKCPSHSFYKENCPIACGVCEKPCGDKACQHKGKINPDTCTCQCLKGYSGDSCEVCPASDVGWCTTVPKSWCTEYSNMYYECSHYCGVC